MTLNDLLSIWPEANESLKLRALNQVIAESLARMKEGEDDLILDILTLACTDYEQNDYFGTEGLNIGND